MRRSKRKAKLAFVAACLLWPVLFFFAAAAGWIWRPMAQLGDSEQFVRAAVEQLEAEQPPNAAFALIREGEVVDEFFMSRGGPIDRRTLFQVMSISKWVTAWVVLTLVESGDLQLDTPVADYLTVWQPPESDYDLKGVTVRRLLSHSAGVNKGDFEGFLPGQEMQSLTEFMTDPADGGAHGNVRIDQFEPGTSMRYSNNGYALLQHLVEQVTGEPFEDYAKRAVLAPLQMTSSTFDSGTAQAQNLTEFYDASGEGSVHRRYGAVAPSSLYTSIGDLSKFLLAHFPGNAGETPGRSVLEPESVSLLQTVQTPEGATQWGLGVEIHDDSGDFTFGHNGSHFNDPAISTEARVNPRTRSGVIAFVSGRRMVAVRLAMEWDYWETGRIQKFLVLIKGWKIILLGWLALVVLFVTAVRWKPGSVR